MPMKPMNVGMSPAATDLGLGSMLQNQVSDETEEMRKKRMVEAQQRTMMGPAASMLLGGGATGLGGFGGR